MPKAKQLTVWVQDHPGALGEVAAALGAKKVNILALTAWVEGERGVIRMVFDKTAAAKRALAARGWEPVKGEAAIVVPEHFERAERGGVHDCMTMPWMYYSGRDATLEQKLELVKQFRANFDSGENFTCGIFTADETEVLGGTGLHPRIGPGGLEIGYWVRASATRQGIATESSAALTRIGFEVCGADRIEIRIEPRSQASFGIPRKLGFVEEATLRRRLPAREAGPLRDVTIFTLFRR